MSSSAPDLNPSPAPSRPVYIGEQSPPSTVPHGLQSTPPATSPAQSTANLQYLQKATTQVSPPLSQTQLPNGSGDTPLTVIPDYTYQKPTREKRQQLPIPTPLNAIGITESSLALLTKYYLTHNSQFIQFQQDQSDVPFIKFTDEYFLIPPNPSQQNSNFYLLDTHDQKITRFRPKDNDWVPEVWSTSKHNSINIDGISILYIPARLSYPRLQVSPFPGGGSQLLSSGFLQRGSELGSYVGPLGQGNTMYSFGLKKTLSIHPPSYVYQSGPTKVAADMKQVNRQLPIPLNLLPCAQTGVHLDIPKNCISREQFQELENEVTALFVDLKDLCHIPQLEEPSPNPSEEEALWHSLYEIWQLWGGAYTLRQIVTEVLPTESTAEEITPENIPSWGPDGHLACNAEFFSQPGSVFPMVNVTSPIGPGETVRIAYEESTVSSEPVFNGRDQYKKYLLKIFQKSGLIERPHPNGLSLSLKEHLPLYLFTLLKKIQRIGTIKVLAKQLGSVHIDNSEKKLSFLMAKPTRKKLFELPFIQTLLKDIDLKQLDDVIDVLKKLSASPKTNKRNLEQSASSSKKICAQPIQKDLDSRAITWQPAPPDRDPVWSWSGLIQIGPIFFLLDNDLAPSVPDCIQFLMHEDSDSLSLFYELKTETDSKFSVRYCVRCNKYTYQYFTTGGNTDTKKFSFEVYRFDRHGPSLTYEQEQHSNTNIPFPLTVHQSSMLDHKVAPSILRDVRRYRSNLFIPTPAPNPGYYLALIKNMVPTLAVDESKTSQSDGGLNFDLSTLPPEKSASIQQLLLWLLNPVTTVQQHTESSGSNFLYKVDKRSCSDQDLQSALKQLPFVLAIGVVQGFLDIDLFFSQVLDLEIKDNVIKILFAFSTFEDFGIPIDTIREKFSTYFETPAVPPLQGLLKSSQTLIATLLSSPDFVTAAKLKYEAYCLQRVRIKNMETSKAYILQGLLGVVGDPQSGFFTKDTVPAKRRFKVTGSLSLTSVAYLPIRGTVQEFLDLDDALCSIIVDDKKTNTRYQINVPFQVLTLMYLRFHESSIEDSTQKKALAELVGHFITDLENPESDRQVTIKNKPLVSEANEKAPEAKRMKLEEEEEEEEEASSPLSLLYSADHGCFIIPLGAAQLQLDIHYPLFP